MNYCSNCGSSILSGQKFCTNCGAGLSNQTNNIGNTNKIDSIKSLIKNNKTYMICGGIVVFFILILSIFFISHRYYNGYTAKKGETLKVREKSYKFNADITSDLKKYVIKNDMFYEGNCLKLGIIIKNLNKNNLKFTYNNFSLTNESKEILYTADSFYDPGDNMFREKIESNDFKSGYLYFTNISPNVKLDDIKYLKISILSKHKKTKDSLYIDYEDYYIEL